MRVGWSRLKIVPGPGEEDRGAVSEADEVVEVDRQPGGPGDEAGELQAGEGGDGVVASDHGHRSLVAVFEGR
jgi:hypothetical protein